MKKSTVGFKAKTGVRARSDCENVCVLGPAMDMVGREVICGVFPNDPFCKI